MPDVPDAMATARADLPLAGEWTLESFCDHLATLDQWPEPPEWGAARLYRNWAFESAALDLALRQAGRALHEVVEREPRPLTFVNSLGLGDPPSTDTIHRRLARYPDVHFKLDAAAAWTLAICEDLAATGAVDIVDFKGQYGMEIEDPEALATMYRHVIATFPDALLEDAHDLPEIAELIAPHAGRVSYDAPIHTVDDLATVPFSPSHDQHQAVPHRRAARAARALRPLRGRGHRDVRRRDGRERRRRAARSSCSARSTTPTGPTTRAEPVQPASDPPEGLPTSPLPPQPEATGFPDLARASYPADVRAARRGPRSS